MKPAATFRMRINDHDDDDDDDEFTDDEMLRTKQPHED